MDGQSDTPAGGVVGTVDGVPVVQTFSYEEVGKLLGVSVQTIYAWVRHGRVPSPNYLGAKARFPLDWVIDVQRNGVRRPGTFEIRQSVRAEVGRLGGQKRAVGIEERAAEERRKLRAVARPDPIPVEIPEVDDEPPFDTVTEPGPLVKIPGKKIPVRHQKVSKPAKKPAAKKPAAKKPAAKKPAGKAVRK